MQRVYKSMHYVFVFRVTNTLHNPLEKMPCFVKEMLEIHYYT